MTRDVLSTLVFALSVFFCCLEIAEGAPSKDTSPVDVGCRRFDLQPSPSWLFSGEWVRNGTELILPDTIAGRLLRYKRAGQELRPTAMPVSSATFSRPGGVINSGNTLIVLDLDRLVRLNTDFRATSEIRIPGVSFAGGDRVEIFHSFIDVEADVVGITAMVEGKSKQKWLGIARLRLGDAPRVERLRTLPSMTTAEGSFYFWHEGPYLARVGAVTYALVFDKQPRIELVAPKPGLLATFPPGYKSPALGSNGRDNTVSAFRAWETSAAPVALFARAQFLYLLTRRPLGTNGTQWTLFQIDPARDRMIRTIDLPTRAPHLVVVPGPREWAIIEKGSLTASGYEFEQKVGPALFIRSSFIEDRASRGDLSKCLESRK